MGAVSTLTWHRGRVAPRHTRRVPACAPRYDPRILAAVRKLDDGRQPMAEICRRVGEVSQGLGLTRPSYVHLRRIITAERERRRTLEVVNQELAEQVLGGRAPRIAAALERAREANARAELRRGS